MEDVDDRRIFLFLSLWKAFLGEELAELVAVVVIEHAVGENNEEVVGLYVVEVFDVRVQHRKLLAACILEDNLLLRRTDLQHTAGQR